MLIPHHCPHCDSAVETDVVDIDGMESRRVECASCDETLVVKPCPACAPNASAPSDEPDSGSDACDTCGGNEVILESLRNLLS